MSFTKLTFVLGLLLAQIAPSIAQTWTACDPTNTTSCPHPPDDPALGMAYNFDLTQTSNASTWNTTAGAIKYASNGAEFTINKRFDSPTVQSEWYIFFGVVEIHMKAATGQGVISSIVLESDDLDEVDWEFMGGNETVVETNYFGKGNQTTFDRALYHPVTNPMTEFHNYTVHWTSDKIEWYIDTVLTRTLNYGDANGGHNFPQTPMTVRLGIWAGGDPGNSKGTIEWAGGLTDYDSGPYTMYVKSAKITDYGRGSAYQYGDSSGSFSSIKSVAGNSDLAKSLLNPSSAKTTTTKTTASATSSSTSSSTASSTASASASATASPSVADKWASLSGGAKAGIYGGAAAVGASIIALISFCCYRQRRRGKAEQQAYKDKQEAERLENEAYKIELKGRSPDSLPNSAATPGEYEALKTGGSYFDPTPQVPPLPPAYASGGLKSPGAFPQDNYANGGLNSPRDFPSGQPSSINGGMVRNYSDDNRSLASSHGGGGAITPHDFTSNQPGAPYGGVARNMSTNRSINDNGPPSPSFSNPRSGNNGMNSPQSFSNPRSGNNGMNSPGPRDYSNGYAGNSNMGGGMNSSRSISDGYSTRSNSNAGGGGGARNFSNGGTPSPRNFSNGNGGGNGYGGGNGGGYSGGYSGFPQSQPPPQSPGSNYSYSARPGGSGMRGQNDRF